MNEEYLPSPEEQTTEPMPSVTERTGPEWEQSGESGFLDRLLSTWKAVIVSPVEFYKNLRTTGGLASPLLFLVIFSMIGAVAQTVYSLVWNQANIVNMLLGDTILKGMDGADVLAQSMSPLFALAGLLFAPIFIIIGTFIYAGILHFFLWMTGGARKPFETTFRVYCYSNAVQVFNVLPFCGWAIVFIWNIVLMIIGLTHTHETDGWRSAMAVLLPLLLCCCLVAVMTIMFAAGIAALIQSQS